VRHAAAFELLARFIGAHSDEKSFEFVAASLREPSTPLRMTDIEIPLKKT